jgi:hypothetical protein
MKLSCAGAAGHSWKYPPTHWCSDDGVLTISKLGGDREDVGMAEVLLSGGVHGVHGVLCLLVLLDSGVS